MTTAQDTPTIGRLLVERRKELGHYQTNAADAIGVSRNSYRPWETGHSVPEDKWVEALMEYLDMSEEEVVVTLYRSRKARQLDITWRNGHAGRYEVGDWFRRPMDVQAAA